MKRLLKRLLLPAASAGCALALFVAGGCFPFTAHNVTSAALMSARETVRSFNIAIDTQYEQTMGWISRTAGTSLGSGVVFAEDDETYYALTNYHVITPVLNGRTYKTKYTVTDINGAEYAGNVEKYDADDDIAIISFAKTEGSALALADYTARLGNNVTAGEFVLAVGNPSGVKNIVTYGEVIGWASIENVGYNVIYHNALINPGNSGGALCDLEGNLLG